MVWHVKTDLPGMVRRSSKEPVVFLGIENGMIQRHWGGEFLYIDHAYFQRGWDKGNCRIVRNGIHLTRTIPQSIDRLQKFKVQIKPYRRNGSNVVVIAPGQVLASNIYKKPMIAEELAAQVAKFTDRPVIIKKKGSSMDEALKDAWAAVSAFSVGAVEAAIAGIPVFSTKECPSYPISAGPLENIENPELPDRYEWANSLAWSTWNRDEIKTIDFKAYQR